MYLVLFLYFNDIKRKYKLNIISFLHWGHLIPKEDF